MHLHFFQGNSHICVPKFLLKSLQWSWGIELLKYNVLNVLCEQLGFFIFVGRIFLHILWYYIIILEYQLVSFAFFLRAAELKSLKGRKYLDAWCVYFWATTPVIISILTFTTYALLGNKLTAAKVHWKILLYNLLSILCWKICIGKCEELLMWAYCKAVPLYPLYVVVPS